jgi:hypothetical protein
MAFHVRCNFPAIHSYARALRAWHDGHVFRSSPGGARGLVDGRKKHLTVEKTENQDIILRLYGHPVATWHPDNSVTIKGWDTISTVVFARHCTPANMSARLCGGRFAIDIRDRGGWRTYRADDITFRECDGTWKAYSKVTPWMISTVNRERAKQAREESGYNEFRAWLIVYVQMVAAPEQRNYDNDKIALLHDRSKWRELAACYPEAWRNAERALESLRKTIYHQHGCIEDKPVPFLG